MANVREIANSAGVSTATVSRVINGNGYVSEAARKKVTRAMSALGYDPADRFSRRGPSGSPSALLKCRSFTILCTYKNGDPLSQSQTGMELMQGLTEGARAVGANLVVDHLESSELIPRCLIGKGADGVFLLGPALSGRQAECAKQMPVVWLLQSGDDTYGDRVQPDHRGVGVLSYRELAARGCTTFCCIGSPCRSVHVEYWHSRAEGFRHAALSEGMKCHAIDVEEPGNHPDSDVLTAAAKEVVDQFVRLKPLPKGVFVANALGVFIHAQMKERGIIPMKDVVLVAGDTPAYARFLVPEPITIDIKPKQLGLLAVDAMLRRIRKPDFERITHLLEPRLIVKS